MSSVLFVLLCLSALIVAWPIQALRIDSMSLRHPSLPASEILKAEGVDVDMCSRLSHSSRLDSIRDDFVDKFKAQIDAQKGATIDELRELKRRILSEAEAAMKSSLGPSMDCDASVSYLLELDSDMEDVLRATLTERTESNTDEKEDRSTLVGKWRFLKRKFLTPSVRKRLKWAGAQLLIVGVNYLQTEANRRLTKHAAEKRLAEVPEFPLL